MNHFLGPFDFKTCVLSLEHWDEFLRFIASGTDKQTVQEIDLLGIQVRAEFLSVRSAEARAMVLIDEGVDRERARLQSQLRHYRKIKVIP